MGGDYFILPLRSGSSEVVQASAWDVDLYRGQPVTYLDDLSRIASRPVPRLLGVASMSLAQIDPFLTADGRSPVSDMISQGSDGFAGLYGLMIRMSLADNDPPALAIRHAISSVSYLKLGQEHTANLHQATSIRALKRAIDSPMRATESLQAMGASMLLSFYENLRNDDSSPLGSAIFFCGCKRIAGAMHQEHNDYEQDATLILDWLFYHDTLYKFSIRHWERRIFQQTILAQGTKIVSKPGNSSLRQQIIPSIGCSLELLGAVCQVIDVVHDPADPSYRSPTHIQALRRLEIRLDSLEQRDSGVTEDEAARTIAASEARLYLLARWIYLRRLGWGEERMSDKLRPLLDEAYSILAGTIRCKKAWPLFVVGLEARDEDERAIVMKVMGRSLEEEPLANLALTRRMIKAAWVQEDLRLDGADDGTNAILIYNTVISASCIPPSFA